jgi:D-glycero-alpha-D-manno-heptose-7-phosphate kinase
MLITRSPLRISLGGGGTDLPSYYRDHGGFVISAAIDKYVWVTLMRPFVPGIYLKYSKIENVDRIDDIEHPIVREALAMMGLGELQHEITTLADIPAGTGLGSSGSFTTALLKALYAHRRRLLHPNELAELACHIEIERLGEPIGKQDQYIAALGGIRDIRFGPGEEVVADELVLSASDRRALQQQIMLFYTGITRRADDILAEQNANVEIIRPQLDLLRDLAGLAVGRLRCGEVDELGAAVREGWEAKRKLASGVSNDQIDQAVGRALDAGATGAKLTGAGGGGFLLTICPLERQQAVREILADMREMPVKLDRLGSRVVLNVMRDIWG